MNEYNARSILKKWSKGIINEIKSKEDIEYLIYKNFIIRIFGVVLLYKAEGKKLNRSICTKANLKEDYLWNKIDGFLDLNHCIKVDIFNIDDEFFDKVVDFTIVFCDDNYEYLDNMMAWLYQYLNINRDDNHNKDTQFFTDQYMVDYLVEESFNNLKMNEIENIKIIDPACGGGNFLVKIIEKIYLLTENNKFEFINLISKVIYGYDIDKMLGLITIINIYIKLIELKIIDTNEILKYNFNIYYDDSNKLGSLLKLEDGKEHSITRATTGDKVKYTDIFGIKYNLLITNPPFKGSREQDKDIREYLVKNYKCSKGDICYAFVERLYDLVEVDGISCFVTQNGWMYLESYKELRKKLLTKGSLYNIVDLGSNSFYDLNGEKTNISLIIYILNKKKEHVNIHGLKSYSYEEKVKNIKLNKELNILKYEDILSDDLYRFDYTSKGKIKEALKNLSLYKQWGTPMQGTSTGDNKKFVSYHWEHDDNNWKLVSKGGGYCKWTGLNIYKVNWGENGEIIKSNPKSVIRNVEQFKDTDLVYSDTGTLGLSVRLLRPDQIFIASGPGIKVEKGDKYCHLAFLNSRIASYYIRILTPKLTISATYISKIPVADGILDNEFLSELSKKAAELKNKYNEKRPINYEYKNDDYLIYNSIYLYAKNDFINDIELELQRLELEDEINRLIISKYEFSNEELDIINSTVGQSPYKIDNNIIDLSPKELDSYICNILNNNCYLKCRNKVKNSLGSEGILEYMAINHGLNPRKMANYIIDNIDDYKLTIEKYYKHTLHRIELLRINYMNYTCSDYNEQDLIDIISNDIREYGIKLNYKKWFENELYKWHYDSFLKRPIIQTYNGDKNGKKHNGKNSRDI